MNAKLLEERTVFKVGPPARVERVRLSPDFQMPPDADFDWVDQSQPDRFSIRHPFAGIDREHFLAADETPVSLDDPSATLAGMPASGPTPEAVPQNPFHFLERPLRHDVAMVIGPATNDGVELTNQVGLTESAILANELPHLVQERVRVFLGGLDEQLSAVLAEVLSEEVESIFDGRDAGFLGRELQTPVAHKLLDQWLGFIFQQFLGRTGDDEVVRVSNEVHFGAGLLALGRLHREGFLEPPFQSVQCQVSQRWRDNPALRGACLGGEEDSLFHEPGFEPLAQHFLVRGNLSEHPFVTDVVETTANVAFQHPRRTVLAGQHEEALPDGVSRTSARTKAVGVSVSGGLSDGFQRQQMQRLHGAVFHRRDTQRPQFPISLRNVDTPQRLGLIPAPPQRADGFVFGRRGSPDCSVHPRRSPALIVRHSFHGQGFAGKRAGQHPLQSFHFVPAGFLSCLDDTRLQPPDLTLTLGPVDLVPSRRLAGGCTRSFIRVHLLFPPGKVLRVLSSRTTNWKSACLRSEAKPLSVRLPNGVRFFQSPLPATPSAFLADAPAPEPGRDVGFTMLVSSDTNELVPAFHTGSLERPCVPCVRWSIRLHCRFCLEPDSVFGSLGMTVPMAVHLSWAFHPACPSGHIGARSRRDRLTEVSSSRRWRDVVSMASDPTVTSRASTDRLLRTEPQVRLTNLFSYRTITETSSLFHTQALPLSPLRIFRPRNRRGVDADNPRRNPVRRTQSRALRVRVQSANSPLPRPFHQRSRVRGRAMSAHCPRQSVAAFSPLPVREHVARKPVRW